MDDATLAARFELCTLPPAELGHREHVRLAWIYLHRDPFEAAAARFCAHLRRYAASMGKADRYHATITWAYLALVNERMHASSASPASPAAADFDAFAAENADLLDAKSGALARYYDAGTLGSPLARAVFLLPDAQRTAPRT